MQRLAHLGLVLLSLFGSEASWAARPSDRSVPGEVLVQVRVPAVSSTKGGVRSLALSPAIEKDLKQKGLLSLRPLTGPPIENKSGSLSDPNASSGPALFHLKFDPKRPVEEVVAEVAEGEAVGETEESVEDAGGGDSEGSDKD